MPLTRPPARDPVLTALQHNLRLLGYRVIVNGRLDDLTERAIASFAKRRKLRVDKGKPEEALAMVCTALKDKCVKVAATH